MKKLVIFIGGLKFGGMERVALIAADLLKERYDVTFVTLYQTEAEFLINHKSYDLNVPPKTGRLNYFVIALRRLWATKKMKKTLKPDIVWSFGMYSNYMNALTKGKEKIIMGIRAYDWFTKPFFSKKMDRWIVSKFDSVNSVSKLIAEDAEVYWGVPANQNRVIYNPYDINYIQTLANEPVDDFVFEDGILYYISMGRLTSQKAFHHLIKAFSLVYRQNSNTALIILGNGELKDKLTTLIEQMGLQSVVFLLGGKTNPYKYLKKSHVYVLSSLAEGFPNALVEAMSIALPVVATDCDSGPREILAPLTDYRKKCTSPVEEAYGIIVPPVSSGDCFDSNIFEPSDYRLAEGMAAMLDDKLRKQYSEKGMDHVGQFDYKTFTEKLTEELNSVDTEKRRIITKGEYKW